ncbi:Hsp20/alpha crystallin family protein [Candidatus Paracaedibacter symbiosus]|uniref:Hsp20/alpha crystallin family protein n=1 Tax=Candidatus Paracaedibacter symbiosus TaxID=244582 RepID=UPI000509A532|nr:Hsp20/alpha crystallin family protein [Candidatus Paracaedibacter symbiosus]
MLWKEILPFRKRTNQPSLTNFRQEIDTLFNRFLGDLDVFPPLSSVSRFPTLNISETNEEITLKAELPGVEENNIKIEVNQNQLTIKGEKKNTTEEKEKEGNYWMQEISYGSFSRTVFFPFELDVEKIKASFSNGVLSISVKKPAENISETKKITITSQ